MEEKKPSPKRRLEKRTGRNFFIVFSVIAALLVTAIFFLYPRNNNDHIPVITSPVINPPENNDSGLESLDAKAIPSKTGQTISEPAKDNEKTATVDSAKDTLNSTDKNDAVTDTTDVSPEKTDSSAEKSPETEIENKSTVINDGCAPYIDNVEGFFITLDSRAYIHDFNLGQNSSVYFPALIQKLADNPPVVTGETNDLYTVLKNTAHFFRIIGKKNILVLKGILDREKETFEQTLADFYYLTNNYHCLSERFNLDLDEESLYLYSGFFLNTMGGRLYLFRRDSKSRMVVNFYAILIIDQANRKGKNKYGIPLTEAIDKLIEEIESTRIELKLREYYLDSLYDMKEKYQ